MKEGEKSRQDKTRQRIKAVRLLLQHFPEPPNGVLDQPPVGHTDYWLFANSQDT